jgi:hypothetical protein
VRQGARFADITRCTGALGSEQLSVYSQLAPAGARRDAAAVQWEFPAFAQAAPA